MPLLERREAHLRGASCLALCILIPQLTVAEAMPDPTPAEVVAFAEVRPGDKVADFLPATGYFTDLFCRAVGDAGRVYSISVPVVAQDARANAPLTESLQTTCTNVTAQVLRSRNFPAPELHSDSDDPGWVYEYFSPRLPVESFVAPEPLDMIWIAERYHALHDGTFGSANLRFVATALLAALKPHGILLIADHAAAGLGTGSIDAEQIKKEMMGAGFEFAGESLLRRTDRFLLKFRKP